jgi:hypothetical protein
MLVAAAAVVVAACSSGSRQGASSTGAAQDWQPSVVEQADVDSGGPVAVVSVSSLDFGPIGCGGSAQQTFTLQNTGAANLQITLSTSGSWFSVSPASATLTSGSSTTVTVTALVPSATAAAKTQTGKVAIATNAAKQAHIDVALSASSLGVTLAYTTTPKEVRFGATPPGTWVPAALVLENTGNAPAIVSYGMPTDPSFTLNSSDDQDQTLAQPGGLLTESFRFQPGSTGTFTATVPLFLESETFCGSGVTSVKLSGAGVAGALTGWPTSFALAGEGIDFGAVACGTTGATESFTLTNGGMKAVTIEAVTLSSDYAFSTDLAAGTVIAAGGSLVVAVTPPPIPYPSSPTATYTGTLTVTTSVASDAPHVLSLLEAPYGAVLSVSGDAAFGTLGSIAVGTTASQPFQVLNSGTAATITVTAAGDPAFGVISTTLDSSDGTQETVALDDTLTFAPTAAASFSGTLTVTADALCQPAPAAISLSGTGTPTEPADGGEDGGGEDGGGEDAGPALTASATLVYFTSNCNVELSGGPPTTPQPRTLTLTNTSASPVTFTTGLGTSYFSVSPAGSTLGAGDSVDLTVSAASLPGNPPGPSVTDSLVIQSSGQTLTIPVRESFNGIFVPTGSIAFGDVTVGTTAYQTVDIVDTEAYELGSSMASPNPPFNEQLANPNDQTAYTQPWTISFGPRTAGAFTGTAQFGGFNVYNCTPNSIALSGTGD